ncbi:MAG: aspartate aminotransferase family protein, partial [Alphaproteobacteria bacterium]|nr:aspartate aminotransferase family protein [Alphaproteobacteria bacterium]
VFDAAAGKPRAPHGGTFNGNPTTMAAGCASMRLLTQDRLKSLNLLGDRARSVINAAFSQAGVAGQATGVGSLVKIHFNNRALRDLRSVYANEQEAGRVAALHKALLNRGYLVGSGCLMAISTAQTNQEIDDLGTAVYDSLVEMRLNDPG